MVLCICCQKNEVRISVPGCLNYCDQCTQELKHGTCLTCKEGFYYDTRHENYNDVTGPAFEVEACNDCIDKAPCSACGKMQHKDEKGPLCHFCGLHGYTCLKCLGLDDAPDKYNYACRDCRQAKKKIYNPYCSFLSTRLSATKQHMVSCNTCKMNLCLSCATKCHTGHKVGKKQIRKEGFCECTCCPPSAPPEAGPGDNRGVIMRVEEPVDIDLLAIQPASPTGDEDEHAPPPNKRKLVMQYNPLELEETQKKVKVYDTIEPFVLEKRKTIAELAVFHSDFQKWKALQASLAEHKKAFDAQKLVVIDMRDRLIEHKDDMPSLEYLQEFSRARELAANLQQTLRQTEESLSTMLPTVQEWESTKDALVAKVTDLNRKISSLFQ